LLEDNLRKIPPNHEDIRLLFVDIDGVFNHRSDFKVKVYEQKHGQSDSDFADELSHLTDERKEKIGPRLTKQRIYIKQHYPMSQLDFNRYIISANRESFQEHWGEHNSKAKLAQQKNDDFVYRRQKELESLAERHLSELNIESRSYLLE
jgi:hypothetical protein